MIDSFLLFYERIETFLYMEYLHYNLLTHCILKSSSSNGDDDDILIDSITTFALSITFSKLLFFNNCINGYDINKQDYTTWARVCYFCL